MAHKHRIRKVIQPVLYIALTIGIAWQSYRIFTMMHKPYTITDARSYQVHVNGNVRRPGVYRVLEGTTQFEILKVAGIRPTSDISAFNLYSQIEENVDVEVGTRTEAVNTALKTLAARLEFFFGEISVIANDGRSLPQHGGLTISPGDRVITEEASQAEISLGDFSRIDVDNFSELVFDKVGVDENNRILTELFQKSGGVWYKVTYEKKEELFRIITHTSEISVGASGADFYVEVQQDQITINLMDGLVLVDRIDGSESINLITGQSLIIYNDGRPFQVSKLTPDVSTSERFSQLSREKINYMSRFMPLNIMVCGLPSVFFIINVNYERNVVNAVHLPPELLIEQFAQDIENLGQAYLYGGPVFVSTFIERILNMKINNYIVIDKDDIIRIGNAMGGLNTTIDEKAATTLNMTRGRHKLIGKNILMYLAPQNAGIEESRNRQAILLRNLFDDLRNKSFVPTLLLSEQLINNTETNFTANNMMEQYTKFSSKGNWTYVDHTLPTTIVRKNNKVSYEPDLPKCKTLFNASEQ